MKKTPAILAVGLIGLAALAVSPAARAAETNTSSPAPGTGVVIAQDTTRAPIAEPIAPRAIQVQAQPGDLVTVAAEGNKTRQVRADDAGTARVTKLTAGATYTVTSADGSTTVTPVLGAGRARNLQVTTTGATDSVTLTWQHAATPARGTITYRVEATPVDEGATQEASIVDEVTTLSATLTGLDPQLRYSFSVTPFNTLGDGKPSIAMMNRNLSALSAPSALAVPAPTSNAPVAPTAPQQGSPAAPEPASAPASSPSAPSPAPASAPARPSTRTVYVCPDGFADQGGTCTKTMGYTYQTQGYTYTRGKTGTEDVVSTCWSGYTDSEGTFHYTVERHQCTITRDVFGDIKNPTPAGWEDTGSNWRKKDDAPAGWSDDGSQWVQTADKIAQVIPA